MGITRIHSKVEQPEIVSSDIEAQLNNPVDWNISL
jgi:hypothetical protein